ncbi:MAG: hypothetical protein ACYTBX_07485 [Planctomycetota bacterium]|jgi:hypothetical protein
MNSRRKGKRNTIIVAIIALSSLLLVVPWRVLANNGEDSGNGLPPWNIQGSWIYIVPVGGGIVVQWTVSPQDLGGVNFTSVSRQANLEATIFGTFPDAEHLGEHIGPTMRTGQNTYESTRIGYGTKKAELPGMLPEIIYISVICGKEQFIDDNTIEGEGTHAFFLASQDADGDGLPDEGQEPIACVPYTFTSKRVQLMPSCVP